ncbi:MAG: hypothetical protein DMF64_19035 [Acidobacteria bacterium]|nr:MAG: hypothetical protein DMF64_19035 [Acidobacteriota bacterium]
MGDNTNIQWTEATWNPLAAFHKETGERGWICVLHSTGCLHCYAWEMNLWRGNGLDYIKASLDFLDIRHVNLDQPLHWKRPRMIFTCSMTDLFGEFHDFEQHIAPVFDVMALANWHTYQLLTKRAERMKNFVAWYCFKRGLTPEQFRERFKHVWFGVSVENQKAANERILHLLQVPAIVRWISAEPLLEKIDISIYLASGFDEPPFGDIVNWVVIGGESGTKEEARRFNLMHGANLIKQCRDADVPAFMKQIGSNAGWLDADGDWHVWQTKDKKGGDMSEWPDEATYPAQLRVRQYPQQAQEKAHATL